ncbi:sugar ABC transporter ATP-binding protein [Hoeflea poritis]|uniref:Sugar ABC transporter ATP-binding protein n=1 Tax=Hoeflea poritis TaxID=2993659 RepID=A0ABT4VS62_9HYPH|nr:sugar ABC transporter ATP-binding protein [Hoeflea poritis]MDA4846922.1 sugar ABC transporter ATP-binding protein [Hoeflea poritis]
MNALSIRNLSKSFAGSPALSDVALELRGGEIHALMGENGAGKSTLIRILAGVETADALVLEKDGRALPLSNAQNAHDAGFRFIHQELNIVPQLSAAENISLGLPYPRRLGLAVDWKELNSRAGMALSRLGVDHIDPAMQAARFDTGDQMLIKIASCLVDAEGRTADLYVFDEPTAALTGEESEKLFAVISGLKDSGAAVLYVSHRMNEVMRLCDRVTVLRDGRNVLSAPISETSKEEIITAMTGRSVAEIYPPRSSDVGEAVVYAASGVSTDEVSRIEFKLRAGEILGVAGLANAGQSGVLRIVMGLAEPGKGRIEFGSEPAPKTPSEAWARGIAYIPRERRREGLMLQMPVCDNAVLPHLDRLRRLLFMANRRGERAMATRTADDVRLKAAGLSQPVYQLSGGNQQKVLFARALGRQPAILVLDEPTRGVDIGAKYDIYALVRELSEAGCPVIMTSTDLSETLGMCDRVLIMRDGAQQAIIDAAGLTPADLLSRIYAS